MPLVIVTATDTLVFADAPIAGLPGPLQAVPKFPLQFAATGDLLNWSNTFPSGIVPTLNGNIALSNTSLTVATGTGSGFPTENFEVSIDDEIIFVTTRSGDVLNNCKRGVEGSTAASHLTGATVQLLVTALSHNQVVAEVVELEQLLGTQGSHVFPTEIALSPAGTGDFTVAHGLGRTPRYALIQMTSNGLIRFQTLRYDTTNLYLNASDVGLTGYVQVWA